MTSSLWGRGLGLLMLGFLAGIVFSNLDALPEIQSEPVANAPKPPAPHYQRQNLAGETLEYAVNYSTSGWDVLTTTQGHQKKSPSVKTVTFALW